jgi:N-acetylglucosamine-6-phosphate deacetylase
MNTQKIKIINGNIITPFQIIENGVLTAVDGKITNIERENTNRDDDALIVDAMGYYVSPGFIDVHIHGAGNADFSDGTVESILTVAETVAKFGTTLLYPTTASCSNETLFQLFEDYRKAEKLNLKGAALGGIHIEGGYFCMSRKGGQNPEFIKNPDPVEYNEILKRANGLIKRWSLAPELPGSVEFIRLLQEKNIVSSIAHTDALYDDVLPAYEAGCRHVTHFYSQMAGVTVKNAKRYAGAIESAYILDEMTVELIADGYHMTPPLLKMIYKIKGADKTALVTDAMRAAGTNDKTSVLGGYKDGLEVIIVDGVAMLPDKSSFAGSVATTDRLVRTMMSADVPLIDAIKMMTYTPAKIMNINHIKGELSVGKDADIVIFDNKINVSHTIVNGKIIYSNQNAKQ